MNKRNIIIGVIALIALLGGGYLWTQTEQTADAPQTGDLVTVTRGNLDSNASATGQLLAQRDAQLAFGQAGTVDVIFVSEGEFVQAGAPLLMLEQSELERAVANAAEGVAIAQADLADLLAGATAAEIAAAEADVASAEANLQQLVNGPTAEELAILQGNVDAAEANVWASSAALSAAQEGASAADIAAAEQQFVSAQLNHSSLQETYDKLLECRTFTTPDGEERTFCPGLGDPEESTRYQLQSAYASLESAQAALNDLLDGPDPNSVAVSQANLAASVARRDAAQINMEIALLPPTEAEIAQAEQQLAQATATLAQRVRGAAAETITLAEVGVAQAEIRLAQAEQALAEATLTAPFAGVITAVSVSEGEQAQGIMVEMVDVDSLEVVLNVDEIDIGTMAEGQTAVVTLEAYPEVSIAAEVAAIAPSSTPNNNSDIVTYEVNLSLDGADVPLRVNMTANASLLTDSRSDVLLVPNRAISVARQTGIYSVTVMQADGEVETRTISIGLRDRQFTEVVDGLSEGETLLINNAVPVQAVGPGA